MPEYVNGWNDDNYCYLVHRDGEQVGCRRIPARWSAFFTGLEQKELDSLSRSSDVRAISKEGQYTRVDFRNWFGRKHVVEGVEKFFESRREHGWKDPTDERPEPAILESDVRPIRRLLSDVGDIEVSATPRAVWLDLEADARKSFPDLISGKGRLLVWCLYDADGNYWEDVLEEDSDDAERAFLARLFEKLGSWDVVLSWNGDAFDFPALQSRMTKLRVKLADGKPVNWKRWAWLDHMLVFKKYNQAHDSGEERSSFSLNAVAQHLLGEGKQDFDPRKTWEFWRAGGEKRAELVRYCRKDTWLMPQIEGKTGFVAMHFTLCKVARIFPNSKYAGRQAGGDSLSGVACGDGFLLRLGAERGYHFPSMDYGSDGDDDESFAGAFVLTPRILGVIDGVDVCDFAGLYPSIMQTWNMSSDTLISFQKSEIWTKGFCKLPSRESVRFRTDIRGIFPVALDFLVENRNKYKKESKKHPVDSVEWNKAQRLSAAYKIIVNSMYGIVGSPFSRYYDPVIAEGVTKTGEWLIKHVVAVMERAGFKPFYGDTDSTMVKRRKNPEDLKPGEKPWHDFDQVVKSLNESWEGIVRALGCTKSFINLESEKSYKRMVLVSAKRYAAKWERYKGEPAPEDMKPEIKGLEFKRGDTLRLARQMQEKALDMLLSDNLPTLKEFRDFTNAWREKLLRGKLELEEVVISQSVKDLDDYATRYSSPRCSAKVNGSKKACGYDFIDTRVAPDTLAECPRCKTPRKMVAQPAHVRVAKLLLERGEAITAGARVEYVVAKASEENDDDKLNPVPAMDPNAMELIDRDYYWDKRVYPPTERLLEVVFPNEEWKDTSSRRARAEAAVQKAALIEHRKKHFDDLPMFAGSTSGQTVTLSQVMGPPKEELSTRVEKGAPPEDPHRFARSRRQVARPRLAPQASPQGGGKVEIRLQDTQATEGLLAALRAAADAHPGGTALVVVLELSEPRATVTVGTERKVARTVGLRTALERLVGKDAIQGL